MMGFNSLRSTANPRCFGSFYPVWKATAKFKLELSFFEIFAEGEALGLIMGI